MATLWIISSYLAGPRLPTHTTRCPLFPTRPREKQLYSRHFLKVASTGSLGGPSMGLLSGRTTGRPCAPPHLGPRLCTLTVSSGGFIPFLHSPPPPHIHTHTHMRAHTTTTVMVGTVKSTFWAMSYSLKGQASVLALAFVGP